MNALIPIRHCLIGQAQVSAVNARELHAFLEVGKDFSTWMKDRIAQYGFVEDQDFVVFPEIGENPTGGRPSKEYALTLDMAKELAICASEIRPHKILRLSSKAHEDILKAPLRRTV